MFPFLSDMTASKVFGSRPKWREYFRGRRRRFWELSLVPLVVMCFAFHLLALLYWTLELL